MDELDVVVLVMMLAMASRGGDGIGRGKGLGVGGLCSFRRPGSFLPLGQKLQKWARKAFASKKAPLLPHDWRLSAGPKRLARCSVCSATLRAGAGLRGAMQLLGGSGSLYGRANRWMEATSNEAQRFQWTGTR